MAGNTTSFSLRGDKEMIRALGRMADTVERRVLTTAVGKAARPILQSAKAKVPIRTGALRNSLGIKRYRSSRFPMALAIIGPRVDFKMTKKVSEQVGSQNIVPNKYAGLVEFGTKPHAIPGVVLGGRGPMTVDHPGTPARPFLRPAFDENVTRAQQVMTAEIWKGIKKEAAKHVR